MIDTGKWRADDVASLYVTESTENETRRIGFSLSVLKSHWGVEFADHLSKARSLGYPTEWDNAGPPIERAMPVDDVLARAISSFGLQHAMDLNARDPYDF